MKKLKLLLIGIVGFSCQDIESCGTDDDLDVMIVRFFDLESQQAKKVGFTIGSGNSIFGEGFFSTDSTAVVLPLNPEVNETSFFFITDTSSHSLTMSYNKKVSIFDPKCDPSLTFVKLDTVRQTFDSTVVVGTVTNRQLTTNVEVYF